MVRPRTTMSTPFTKKIFLNKINENGGQMAPEQQQNVVMLHRVRHNHVNRVRE